MNKTHDYIHEYKGYGIWESRCRIRIYESDDRNVTLHPGGIETEEKHYLPVVICTEGDNPGTSITNDAEHIAAEIIDRHADLFDTLGFDTDRPPFIWVEHYEEGSRRTREDPNTFDLVTFSHYIPTEKMTGGVWIKVIGTPHWKPSCRREVEELIGQEVD